MASKTPYCYILVRKDLSPGQQVVQSCHAVAECARNSYLSNTDEDHPHIVVCGVKDENALLKAHTKLQKEGVRCQLYREPDAGDEATALATAPVYEGVRRLFRNFQILKPANEQPATTSPLSWGGRVRNFVCSLFKRGGVQ